MKKIFISTLIATIAIARCVEAQEPCPPPGGRCFNKRQLENVQKAVKELDEIHDSPAKVTIEDPITIVHDWAGRVYINGGDSKPVRMKLKLGSTIDRDLAVTLPTKVYYQPKPPDPMFRLRVRAQFGLLPLQLASTISGKSKEMFFDAGLGWDFFHLGILNTAIYTGVYSSGIGLGLDFTRNFGPYVGYSLIYDGFKSAVWAGIYFSLN